MRAAGGETWFGDRNIISRKKVKGLPEEFLGNKQAGQG
jgi:hypothetical protein